MNHHYGVIPNFLGGELLEKRTKIFNYYRPIELDYTLKAEEKQKMMKEWANKSFSLISEYITEEIIDKSTDDCNMHLRHGVKELFAKMNEQNITVVIMSAGIGNIIKSFLKKENVLYDNIVLISNFFEFINNKPYIDLKNIMATSNKNYLKIPIELRQKLQKKDKIILVGDIIEDTKMVDKEQLHKTITVGFLNVNVDENFEEFNKNFDIVITDNDDFNSIKEILNFN